MKLAPCLLPLLLSARAVLAAGGLLTDYFPPETKVVFGIRVHNIVASSLAQGFTTQAQAASADWVKSAALTGFDPLRDLDEVLIATSGVGEKPPTLIVLSGHFDLARLSEGAHRYRDVAIFGGEKENDSVIALLDGSTAIAGDAALVHAALDRRGSGARIDAALADRITSVRQRYDVWGMGERPAGFVAPMPEAKALESIDRFQFGMLLSSGLELGAEIHARSAQDADKLNEALQMLSAMLKAQQPSGNATKFDVESEGGTLKLTVSIPEAELKKAIQTETGIATPTLTVAPTSAPAAIVTAPQVAAVKPEPAVVSPAPRATSKPTTSQVFDKEGNTVVLKLPGKK